MNRTRGILVILFCLATCVPRSASQESAEDHLKRGNELASSGKRGEAIAEFSAAIHLDSSNSSAHWGLAKAFDAESKEEEAFKEYQNALKLDPKLRDDKTESAERHFQHANAFLGRQFGHWYAYPCGDVTDNWINHCMDNGAAEYRIALLLDPDYVDAHVGLGVVLAKFHKTDAAIEEFLAALHLDPQSPEAHLGLGKSLEKKGNLKDALQEYCAALSMEEGKTKCEKLSAKLGIKKDQAQPLETEKNREDHPLASQPDATGKPGQATVAQSSANETGPLFRVDRNGKYGYIDKTGTLVIPLEYDDAGKFSQGLASVIVGAKLVEVDVVEYPVVGGGAPVKKRERHLVGGKYGYIDITGKMVIPPYDFAGEFSEGLAVVVVGGKWITHGTISLHGGGKFGYIDKTGQILIKPQYSQAAPFSEGLAHVAVGGKWADDMLIGEKWGYIDKTGKLVIPAKYEYDDHADFSEGLALVKVGKKYGYIDKTGNMVVPAQYDSAHKFSEGLAAVKVGRKWGFIDKTGTILVAPQYDYGAEFSEGLAAISIDGKLSYIDKTGKIVIPLGGEEFSEGLAAVFAPGKDEQKGKHGYIDKTGTMVIQPQFGRAEKFSQGLAEVTVDGKTAYIDHSGKFVWGPTN